MKVLVTGGHGFIGSWVVEDLEAHGHQPVVFDRHYDGARISAEAIIGDIRDETAVFEAMAHVQGWIHLAGVLGTQETIQHPRSAIETNVLGGLNVLEAASAYSLPGAYIAVGNHWMDNTYSITKTTVERFCRMYAKDRKLPVSIVRAYNAYGPGQSIAEPFGPSKVRKIMPSFACRALTGQPLEVYGDGMQIMDMVHVKDVARVLVQTLEDTAYQGRQMDREAGTGRRTTVLAVAQEVAINAGMLTGYTPAVVTVPMRPGEPRSSVVLAENPYPLDYVRLEDGVAETVKWYHDGWLQEWRSSIESG